MKFYCERTSKFVGQPCDEAERVNDLTYTIEINSLEQLMDFIDRHGEVVVFPSEPDGRPLPTIEIYDTWRE